MIYSLSSIHNGDFSIKIMARTFLQYKDEKGFEINEAFVQLAIHYIYTDAKKAQYIFSNKQELLEDFEDKINGIQTNVGAGTCEQTAYYVADLYLMGTMVISIHFRYLSFLKTRHFPK